MSLCITSSNVRKPDLLDKLSGTFKQSGTVISSVLRSYKQHNGTIISSVLGSPKWYIVSQKDVVTWSKENETHDYLSNILLLIHIYVNPLLLLKKQELCGTIISHVIGPSRWWMNCCIERCCNMAKKLRWNVGHNFLSGTITNTHDFIHNFRQILLLLLLTRNKSTSNIFPCPRVIELLLMDIDKNIQTLKTIYESEGRSFNRVAVLLGQKRINHNPMGWKKERKSE